VKAGGPVRSGAASSRVYGVPCSREFAQRFEFDMFADHHSRFVPTTAKSASSLPVPLLSSKSRSWNGIVVELHHFRGVDAVVPVHEHIVGVHVAGSVNLLQSRSGRTCVKHVHAGDITITPFGEPKRFQHAGENIVIVLKLAPAFVQSVAGEEYALDPTRFEILENAGTPDPKLVALGKQLLAGLESEGSAGRMHAESLTTQLAIHLLRHYCTASASLKKPIPKLPPRKLQRAIEYIDANLREDISLAGVAEALAMSPWHFAHAFRQTTGLPPHRFVLDRRIELAKSLLRETDLPITEIADRIGCASHSHFSVLFRRRTGQTPRDYRN
jgi:AraC family transcriptional regulator